MFKKQKEENNYLETSIKEYIEFQREIYGDTFPFSEDEERAKYINSIELLSTVIGELLDRNNLTVELLNRILPDYVKYLINKPTYPDLIYIKRDKYSSHFHLEDGIIYEAENIHVLPNLNRNIRTERINSFFNGMTLIEARSLLCQMNILPQNNDLDRTIETYQKSTSITEKFYRNLIEHILSLEDEDSLRKAKVAAKLFNYDYDFTKPKELKKVK